MHVSTKSFLFFKRSRSIGIETNERRLIRAYTHNLSGFRPVA